MASSLSIRAVPEICLISGITSIVVPPSPESAGVARRFIKDHTRLDSMRLMEAGLLVTELICNAIKHAADVDELRVEIQGGFEGVRTSVVHESLAPLQYDQPGLGFRLLERLSRRWGHEFLDGRLRVWFVVRKPGVSATEVEASDRELAGNPELDKATYSEALVRRHRDLALTIARRYQGKGVAFEDLNQVAMMALHSAIQRYDPAMGDLRPYAAATISGELKHYLRDCGWAVRVPRPVQERALQASKALEALTQRLGREPTVVELAGHLELSEEEALEAVWARLLYTNRSIDRESASTGLTILDSLRSPDGEVGMEDSMLLEEALACLPEREALIVELKFMEDKTQQEIAEIIGISQMHVSRLLAGALRAMRHFLEAERADAQR